MRSSNTFRDFQPGWALHPGLLRLVYLSLAVVSMTEPASAIDPRRMLSQYIRDKFGPEQGFPKGAVYSIAQTPDGYLWFGVEAGLVRFDGIHFLLIPDNSKSLNITQVLGLVAARDGGLWLRMGNSNLLRYRHGAFDNPPADAGMAQIGFTATASTTDGNLLVSQMQQGAITFRQNQFEILASGGELPRTPILSVAQTSDGEIWMGTRDAGLFRLSKAHTYPVVKDLPDLKINCMLPDGKENVWIGTDSGIARWNGSELTTDAIPKALNNFQVLALTKDRDGNLWIGTDSRGLIRLTNEGVADFDKSDTGRAVTAIFEDREGNLWVGGVSGIERIRDSAFVSYSPAEGILSDGNIPVFADAENRTWFAPVTGGLWWLKDGQHGRVPDNELEKDVVYSITGLNGDLWLGRRSGGLSRLRASGGTPSMVTYSAQDGLAQNSVFAVHASRDGTVWAGTVSGGVSRLQNGKFATYTSGNGLALNTILSITESRDGTMWFGTAGGLSGFSRGQWTTYTTRAGLPSDTVDCLFEDSQGTLWAGTTAGLAFMRSGRFQVLAGMPPALREPILGIAEDRRGALWLATSSHVLQVNREGLVKSALTAQDVHEYGIGDGLRGVEGVKRHRSVTRDMRGRIWFSLNRGLSVVDPARIAGAAAPAIVQVQTISVDGVPLTLRDSMRISAIPKRVTIGFVGLSLAAPERVKYRFRLNGNDNEWSQPTLEREISYTNLDPGNYRFRVIGSNPEGTWSDTEAGITFIVEPAFWQTWWFRAGLVLVLLGVISAGYRYRLQQLTHQLNLRFEERLSERTRIAQELHDTLLQGFLSASMQLHATVDTMPEDAPSTGSLKRILNLMTRVTDEGRNVVRGLRTTTDSSLEQALARTKDELSVNGKTAFQVIVEGTPRPVRPMIRDEVLSIGREAIVNAFRHSGAARIDVEVHYTSYGLTVLVRDNGCGIDPRVVQAGREGHWGLPGMRERADRIGAQLRVWSGGNGGTEVEVIVPSHTAFEGHRSSRLPWRSLWRPRKRVDGG